MKKTYTFQKLLLSCLIMIIFPSASYAYTTVSGDVSGQTWTSGSTYYVSATISVAKNNTLTIEDGVVVKFAPATQLNVKGTLIAIGTSSDHIIFTSRDDDSVGEVITESDGTPNPGNWSSLYFQGNSTNQGTANMDYCDVKYAGSNSLGEAAGIYFYLCTDGFITNSSVKHSALSGMRLYHCSNVLVDANQVMDNGTHGILLNAGSINITNCDMSNNANWAAYLENVDIQEYTGNSGSGNGFDAFALTGTVNQDLILAESINGLPFVFNGLVTVSKNFTLTFLPGEIIKLTAGQINVKGILMCEGTVGDPIVFTSFKDDSYGGDLNNDGNIITQPAPGDWHTLYLQGNSTNQGYSYVDHAIFRYGGANYSGEAATVYHYLCDQGEFKNSTIEHSAQNGLRFYSSSGLDIDNNTISNSNGHGILNSSSNVNFSNCVLNNNASWAIYLDNVTIWDYPGHSGSGNGYDAIAVKGTVTEDLTLSSAVSGFPFVINGLLTVNDGKSLTFPAGEIIKLSAGQLKVLGWLYSQGTQEDPIVFTSFKDDSYGGDLNNDGILTTPAAGDWYTVTAQGNGANDGKVFIDHSVFRYGGANYSGEASMVYFNQCDEGGVVNSTIEHSSQNGLRFYSSSGLDIDNNTISNNNGHGVLNSSASINISNCEISNNASWAIYLDNVSVLDYPGNSGSGNGYDAIALKGTVTEDVELSSAVSGFPFVINGLLTVNDGKSLTLPAGEIIKLSLGNIKVLGWLYSQGTDSEPVVFTSFKDDSYGGDLNNDGILSTPAPGDWYTVTAQGNSSNDGKAFIDYTIFRYGGANYSGEASMVYFNQCDEGYISNSIIEHSIQNGLRFYSSSGLDVDLNEISNNNGHGILNSSSNINFSNCEISNNTNWAVYLDNATILDYPGNSGSGNGYDAFAVKGTVNQDLTLSSAISGFPFVVNGLITVNDGFILTIPAGEIIKLTLGNIKVNGSLYCDGTPEDPIVFTSFQDDSYGGDLNKDGITSSPAPGNWYTVTLSGNSSNDGIGHIQHCIFRYGGANYAGEYANVYFNQTDQGYFNNNTIEHSFYHGIYVYASSGLDFMQNTSESCGSSGFYFRQSPVDIIDCVSNNNTAHGIYGNVAETQISGCQINNNGGWAAYLENCTLKEFTGNSGSGNHYEAFGIYGTVNEDITLSEDINGFPYVVTGLLTINQGKILTIPAGELVKVTLGNIKVNGSLYCDGTSEDPIVFTSFKDDSYGGDLNNDDITSSPSPGDWYTLTMSGNGANDGISHIQHCIFRYGGANYAGEYANVYFNQTDQGYFNNNTIEHSFYHGIYVYASSGLDFMQNTSESCGSSGFYFRQSPVDIIDCVSNNNTAHGIYGNVAETQISGCQINNNGGWAAYLENCTLKEFTGNSGNGNHYEAFGIYGTVNEDITLSKDLNGFPFVINGLLTVNAGSILTLTAGEIIKMNLGVIKVNGSLIADGQAKNPIVFTSFKDDETGGDLNNDGIVSLPAPGDWYMVSVNGNAANDGIAQLDHCVFRYGGANYSSEYATLYFYADHPESFVTYCTIDKSFNYGLRTVNSALKVRSSTFSNNLSYNVYVTGSPIPDLGSPFEIDGGFNHFVPNLDFDYQMYYSGTEDLFAFYNDWGFYTESEIDNRIYDNEETGQAGMVMFNPWFDPEDPTFFLDPEFSVDFEAIHVDGQLQFTDQSTGYPAPSNWEWDFQTDGSVESESQNPGWSYDSEGLKTVCLVVSNGAYEVTLVKEDFINVGNYGAADIASVSDVPDDQGGWVYVNFTKSEFDTNSLVASTEYYTVQLNDGNGWFSAGYSSAYGYAEYSVIAHTPFDSTSVSNGLIDFRVIASMDEGTYVSDVIQGYSVDNLKPMAPSGIETILEETIVHLTWDESPDDDFNYFAIYRSEFENEFPNEPYQTLTGTSFDDIIGGDEYFYYMITAFDFAGNESDGSSVISTFKSLELIIPEGWSGISTYLDPVDSNIENMFDPVIQNLVLIENQAGIYWPDQSLNTLIDWDIQSGYVIKTSQQSSLNITSSREKFNTIDLNEGWNIIPVLSQNNVNVAELFIDADIEIVKDVASWGVYWPDLNVNSLENVMSGKAYYVKSNIAQTIIYPDLGQDGSVTELPIEPENITPWNDVSHSPVSHLVGFPANTLESLEDGDFIGAFTADGVCAGWIKTNSEAAAIAVNGNDQFGGIGFADGETLNYKLYRPSTSEEFLLEVEYVPGQSQPGIFSADGLSVVAGLKLSPTGIDGVTFSGLQVYPNPARDFVNVTGVEGIARVIITNSSGREVMARNLTLPAKVNLNGMPEGVYFMKISTDRISTVEKLVIK